MVLPKLSSFNLPWPANWQDIFGAERPVVLEIGFGYGHFLDYLHQTRTHANIIGLEISNQCLVKAESAITRKKWENVRVIRSYAETALYHLFEPESISEIHVNFPDPWFKERHSGRRLMQRDTLDAMVSRLTPDGKLYLATDILAYAEMSAELLADTPTLTNQLESPWVNQFEDRITTKYERKAQEVGRECYYFMYRRNDTPAPSIPVIKELDMPHIVIKTPLSLDELAAIETGDEYREEDEIRIKFVQKYHSNRTILFEVFVHEATIDQHISIVLLPHEDYPDEYTLKLGAIGSPRPTEGLHRAVGILGSKLLALHPDAEIIHNKVKYNH